MRQQHLVRSLRVGLCAVVMMAALVGGVATASPPAGAAVSCEDGRTWTADVYQDGLCHHQNLCAPDAVNLAITDRVTWSWRFPARCPMDAIGALGLVLQRQVATAANGDLSQGTVTRMEDHGVGSPPRQGSGSVPVTCGEVKLRFTVVAGSEVVATATGHATTRSCTSPGGPTDPAGPAAPALLGDWDATSGPVASVARLYWAVFGRIPDAAGFAYWMARMDAGLSIGQVARTWTDLPEWQNSYAGTDNATFVALVYQNVLGRPSEKAGFDYWVDRLDTGLRRDRLVLLFSDSPEFRGRTNTN